MFKKDYKVKGQGLSKSTKLWIAKVTLLAFFMSLILSIFSELIRNSNNLIIAIVILLVFMALNVLSDMVGLAITSCQIENIENSNFDEKLKKKCKILMLAQRDPDQTPDLQNCKRTPSCCLKPLRVWQLLTTAIEH